MEQWRLREKESLSWVILRVFVGGILGGVALTITYMYFAENPQVSGTKVVEAWSFFGFYTLLAAGIHLLRRQRTRLCQSQQREVPARVGQGFDRAMGVTLVAMSFVSLALYSAAVAKWEVRGGFRWFIILASIIGVSFLAERVFSSRNSRTGTG